MEEEKAGKGWGFFPEESFGSWGSYVKALGETRLRFADRLTARSADEEELNEMRARSQHEMKKTLTWWDLMWFGMGAVIGAGIFVLTGLEAKEGAGPAVVLSYVISGVSAMLSVFCYTEFAVEIPVAGEIYSLPIFARRILPLKFSSAYNSVLFLSIVRRNF